MKIMKITKTVSKALLLALLILFTVSQLQAQTPSKPPLTLADILTALRSKRIQDPEEKNRLLIEAVIERGVTFNVSTDIEKELEMTGASKALIDAIKLKSPLAKTAPTPAPTPATPDYKPYEERADMYVQKGEYDLAILEYNRAIDINPKEASLYVKRGFAFFNKKNFDLALADYNKAIEIDSKTAMAYFYRGSLYERNGNLAKAAEDYQKAVELDQNNEQAKSSLKRVQELQARTAPTPTPPQGQVASRNPVQPPIQNTTQPQPQPRPQTQPQPLQTQPNVETKEQPKREARKEETKKEEPKKEEPKKEEPKKEEPKKEEVKNPGTDSGTIVGVGQLTAADAVRLVKPTYPPQAQRSNIEGQVRVEVVLDEQGNVTSAKAIDGPALLRAAAEEAASKSKFKPVIVNDKPAKARGFIVYNFVRSPQQE